VNSQTYETQLVKFAVNEAVFVPLETSSIKLSSLQALFFGTPAAV